MRKGDLSRLIMLQKQSRTDGREIAHLVAAMNWLAQRLAELGVHPRQTVTPQASGEALDELAKAWRAAGHRAADALHAQRGAGQEGRAWN